MSTQPTDGDLEALLDYVHERRNFDFRGYRRASLTRRIYKRMKAVGVDDYQRYIEILEANPGEYGQLFDTILINVTALMRDPEAWQALAEQVIPTIAAAKSAEERVRIWSAGCASGEEAYTLAVLFAEALGVERFRQTVKIYATDADNDALADARHGRYPRKALEEAFGAERAERNFEYDQDYGVFRADLRRALIFGRHDLVRDPPISRLDLVTCRNTLMYFTSDVQSAILASFHFALNPGGYLFLGRSEALVSRAQLFQPVDTHQHILRKDGIRPELTPPASAQPARPVRQARSPGPRPPTEAAFEQSIVPQIVLDGKTTIVLANRAARRMLSPGSMEVGRNLREAELSYRPVDLRSPVEQVLRERRPAVLRDARFEGAEQPVTVDINITPLEGHSGAAIVFLDVSRFVHLREELEHSRRELESAYEELQSTVEELETTNEELQSTNEELETTNEELHSTNEELETMNEELQSTNEELETINNELRDRGDEVAQLNQFLQSILSSLQSAVVVLGPQMEVRAWNRQAEDLWGLRGDEVLDRHFLNLDIGFPVEKLRSAIRSCLTGKSEREQLVEPAVNRRGRQVEVTVIVSCLVGQGPSGGVILVMDAVPDG